MFTQKHLTLMLATWMEVLLDFDFEVIHHPGILNVVPDALSRILALFREGDSISDAQQLLWEAKDAATSIKNVEPILCRALEESEQGALLG